MYELLDLTFFLPESKSVALTVTTGVAIDIFSKISLLYDIGSNKGALSFKSSTLQYTVKVLDKVGCPASCAWTTSM